MKQIWKLTRMQLGSALEFLNMKKNKNTKKNISVAMILFLGFSLFALISVSYSFALGQIMKQVGELCVLPGFFMAVTCMITLFTSIYKVNGILFGFKDYDILMSLPVKTSVIVASRLMLLYIINLVFTLGLLLPNFVVYAILAKPEPLFYMFALIGVFLVPLVPMILASIIGVIVAFLSSRFKHSNAMGTILMLVVFMGIFLSVFFLQSETQLVQISIGFHDIMNRIYPLSILYHKGIVEMDVLSLIAFSAISLIAFISFSCLFGRCFKWLNSRLSAIHAKSKYTMTALRQNSSFIALYKKEAKRYFSCGIYLFNTGFALILMILAAAAFPILSANQLHDVLAVPELATLIRVMAPYFLCFMVAMTMISASSISLEGKNFWILKSAPVKAETILNAKIAFPMSLTVPITFFAACTVAISLKMEGVAFLSMVLIPLSYCYFTSVFGLFVNLKFPLMDWKNETVVVKQSVSSMIATLCGLLFVGVPIASTFIFWQVDAFIIQFSIVAIVLMISIVIHQYLKKHGEEMLAKL